MEDEEKDQGQDKKNGKKKFGKSDPRDLVLTVCPVKASGHSPPPLSGHTCSLLNGNRLFLYGGANEEKLFGDSYLFDLSTLTWSREEAKGYPHPPPLFGHTATVIGNHVYIFGGITYSMTYNFDSEKDGKGKARADQSKGRYSSPLTAIGSHTDGSGAKLSLGSVSGAAKPSSRGRQEAANSLYALHTEKLVWEDPSEIVVLSTHFPETPTKPFSQPKRKKKSEKGSEEEDGEETELEPCAAPALYLHSACAVGSLIVVFGGCTEPDFKGSTNDIFIYDTVARRWYHPKAKGTGPSPRHGHSATLIGPNRVLIFGGVFQDPDAADPSPKRFNDVFILDLDQWQWTQPEVSGSPPMARAFHNAGLVASKDSSLYKPSLDLDSTSTSTTTSSPSPSSSDSDKTEPSDLDSVDKNNLLYIFAGETQASSSELCVLNLSTWSWARPLFDGSFEHEMHASVVISDKLLVFGGLSRTSGILDDFFFINTVSIRSGITKNDFTFKLVLVGDSSVGKSCLMTRFVEDRFSDIHLSTIGIDFKTVTTMLEGKIVKLHIWDTAGQERFAQVTTHYYRGADGAIVVYDVSNKKSFESVENWVSAIVNANPDGGVSLLLVGNKNDLLEQRQVTKQQGQELAKKVGAPFIETSAKDACNVDVMFLNLAKKLVKNRKVIAAKEKSSGGGIKLDSLSPKQRNCCKSD